jgi:hypothetical protein
VLITSKNKNIQCSNSTGAFLEELCRKLNVHTFEVLEGWPFEKLTLQNLYDVLAVYHELSLHDVVEYKDKRWQIAGNIVARIQRDNQER